MSIADLKTRLHDAPGIETLTMQIIAGRQNYSVAGRLVSLDVAASDQALEEAIRAAIASPAVARMPAGTPIPPAIAPAPAANVQAAPTAPATAPKPATSSGHPGSAASAVQDMMQEHVRLMRVIDAASLESLRISLERQRRAMSAAPSKIAEKIDGQTDDFLSIMGQFTNDLGI
jgi:type IV secretory pathway VirB10-like protein